MTPVNARPKGELATVLLINSLAMGGAERVATCLAETAVAQGRPFRIVCLERDDFFRPRGVTVDYLDPVRRPGAASARIPIRSAVQLRRYVARHHVRVVVSFLHRASFASILARLLGSRHRTVIGFRSGPAAYGARGLAGRGQWGMMRLLYPRADAYLYQTVAMRDAYRRFTNPHRPIWIIPNPVDVEQVAASARQEEWLSDGRCVFVMLGRLQRVKRCDIALRALSRLRDAVSTARTPRLILIGEGPMRPELERLTRDLGLDADVVFTGSLSNPFPIVSRAHALVLTSESEGFPNVLVESLSLGVPVIASDCVSGPREILDVRGPFGPQRFVLASCGILTAVASPEATSDAMALLMSDRDLRDRMARSARERALTFAPSVIEREFHDLVTSVGAGG